MKNKKTIAAILLTLGVCLTIIGIACIESGCSTDSAGNVTLGTGTHAVHVSAATITMTEKDLALAAKIAAPLVGDQRIANDLDALSAVSTAYGNAPVPTGVLQATTPLTPQLAAQVIPLVTGKANGPRTQAIISGAAALVRNGQTPASTSP